MFHRTYILFLTLPLIGLLGLGALLTYYVLEHQAVQPLAVRLPSIDTNTWQVYHNKSSGLIFRYPRNWEINKSDESSSGSPLRIYLETWVTPLETNRFRTIPPQLAYTGLPFHLEIFISEAVYNIDNPYRFSNNKVSPLEYCKKRGEAKDRERTNVRRGCEPLVVDSLVGADDYYLNLTNNFSQDHFLLGHGEVLYIAAFQKPQSRLSNVEFNIYIDGVELPGIFNDDIPNGFKLNQQQANQLRGVLIDILQNKHYLEVSNLLSETKALVESMKF